MKDQFENLLAPDGLLTRFLYLVLFAVIFCLCRFILIALVIFQFLHLVIGPVSHVKMPRRRIVGKPGRALQRRTADGAL